MKKLSAFIYNKTTTKIMIIAIIIFIVFTATLLPQVSKYTARVVGEASPDTSLVYSAQDLYDMAESYGEDGRRVYITLRFTFDLVWPFVYLFFMVTVLTRLLYDSKKPWVKYLHLLPLLGGLFDFLENIGASIVMGVYPSEILFVASATPIFTLIKWSLLGVSFLLIAVTSVIRIIKSNS